MSWTSTTALESTVDHENFTKEEEKTMEKLRKKHKLCGFLKKPSGQKLLKTWKTYWFMYSDNSCRLIYYDSCHQVNPTGEIDISRASFSLETENYDRPGLFRISTPEQSIELEAKDQNAALYWLQELQKHRRRFSTKRNANIKRYGVTFVSHVGGFESGLLRDRAGEVESDNVVVPLAVPVDMPYSVGEDAMKNLNSSHSVFNNIRSQLRNGFTSILSTKNNEQPSEDGSSPDETKSGFSSGKNRNSFRRSLPFAFGTKDQKETANFTPNLLSEQCKDVTKLETEVVHLRNNASEITMELKATKELVLFLQKQLDLACRQKESLMRIHRNLEEEKLMKIVMEKDVELVRANETIDQLHKELEELNYENMMLKQKHDHLNESFDTKSPIEFGDRFVLRDAHHGKGSCSQHTDRDEALMQTWTLVDTKSGVDSEIEKLKDELHAFRSQNRFLNSEILQLNLLRKDSEERETIIRTTCIDWEAKYYAIQSKYMVLLNEFHTPSISKPPETASQLLHDAVTDMSGPDYLSIAKVMGSNDRYDIYGFLKSSASTVDLLQGACILRRRSEDIVGQLKNNYSESWLSKWDGFMANFGNRSFQPSPTLKELIRTGIPFIYRSSVWKSCVNYHVKHIRDSKPKNYYETLLAVKKQGPVTVTSEKQIELDLLRTLPHNKHFETAHSDGLPKLRRVLIAYSRHNELVGYCQGLNRLVAIALLFLSEEDAFWCLVAIVDVLMPCDYYTRDLIGTQVDQLVLKELLVEKSSRLYAHLDKHSIDVSLFTFHWFMCIFVDCLPVETFLCIWDAFLYEGNKILFRFALAILKLFEEDCLKVQDSVGVSEALRNIMEKLDDWHKIAQVAFGDVNPFPMRMIGNKREQYLPLVKQEVDRLNIERASIQTYLPRKSFTRAQ